MIATQFNNVHLCLKPLTLLHNISGTFIFICLFYDKFRCHESEHIQVLDVADVITNIKKRSANINIKDYKYERFVVVFKQLRPPSNRWLFRRFACSWSDDQIRQRRLRRMQRQILIQRLRLRQRRIQRQRQSPKRQANMMVKIKSAVGIRRCNVCLNS